MDPSGEEHEKLRQEIGALRKKVEEAPEDVELRLALVSLLLAAGQPQGAWHNCIYVLDKFPNHVQALGLAKKAAETVGAHERADEYVERLAELLSTSTGRSGKGGTVLRLIRGGREDSGKFRRPRLRSRGRVR